MPCAARQARIAWSSNATGAPNTAMIPSPANLSTVPPYRRTTAETWSNKSVMISLSRSAPTVAAISMERTTSANSTVTCLYSADRLTCVTGAPHSLQNFEFGGSSVPHDPHGSPAAVSAPRLLSSTSVSFHRVRVDVNPLWRCSCCRPLGPDLFGAEQRSEARDAIGRQRGELGAVVFEPCGLLGGLGQDET